MHGGLLYETKQFLRIHSAVQKFWNDFFKNQRHLRMMHNIFFVQNKLHWHIYRLLRGRKISEQLPKISLFGTSLIHQLRLLGSQQHLQSGVLLT
jgi:hypothetical protein